MLKYIDALGIFDQSITYPFFLLDGHHSRMMLPYLKNINPSLKWYSCFGVPYATHICHVADVSSLNGTYKIELVRAQRLYVEKRAFPKILGNRKNAIRAISERNWNNILTNLPSEKKYGFDS
jgi:hypothetical protein